MQSDKTESLRIYSSADRGPADAVDPTQPAGTASLHVTQRMHLFRDALVTWEEIVPFSTGSGSQAIRLALYVWPMIVIERRSSGLVLQRLSRHGRGL